VALAADDRGIFYKAAFGMRAVDKPEPMTADSVFRIASMTKAVTGAAAVQLVEQGRIFSTSRWATCSRLSAT
jgi:methyl acetate hydrolase